jgi:hypothetical protein
MPRYFFHLVEPETECLDEEGRELADPGAARLAAIHEARGVICGDVTTGLLRLNCSIEIRDEAGGIVLSVPFGEALEIVSS